MVMKKKPVRGKSGKFAKKEVLSDAEIARREKINEIYKSKGWPKKFE